MSYKNTRLSSIVNMLEKEPHDEFLNYALAMEYLAIEQLDNAAYQFEKVLTINPNYIACFYQLGQLKEKLGDYQSAIIYYKKGIELAYVQNNKKALGELKEALWMLDDD